MSNKIPRTTASIHHVSNLSDHAKAAWMVWSKGISLSEEAWEDYLVSVKVPYFPLEDCMDELRRNGWLA
ncbi:hypothetical protein [Streptomyces sp. NPDC047990]|uniref:hypothetical protein n=1 Tax=Streptomyces sp. NPDC047990 TaxID=3365496 RepID=UPI003712381A